MIWNSKTRIYFFHRVELLLEKNFHDKRMLCKNDSFEEIIISNVFGILYNTLK